MKFYSLADITHELVQYQFRLYYENNRRGDIEKDKGAGA